jgi:hypothetical protein
MMSPREVLRNISGQDLQIRFRGQGVVVEMEPTPGTALSADKRVTLYLKPYGSPVIRKSPTLPMIQAGWRSR